MAISRRLIILCICLAVSITLKPILTTAQQKDAPRGDGTLKQSEPPNRSNQQRQAQDSQSPTDQYDQTSGQPITVNGTVNVVNQPSAEEQQRQTAEKTKGIQDKARDLLNDSSKWPEIGTLMLAAVAVGLSWAAYKQTRKATEAALRQAGAAEKQFEAIAKEYALIHRPRLIVRHVVLPLNFDSDLTGGYFDVANIGDLPGTILDAHSEVFISKELPMKRPYDEVVTGNIPDARTLIIPPGTERRLTMPDFGRFDFQQFKDIRNSIEVGKKLRIDVYILGYVLYGDGHGTQRRTSFARRFDFISQRFIAIENSDYNYAD